MVAHADRQCVSLEETGVRKTACAWVSERFSPKSYPNSRHDFPVSVDLPFRAPFVLSIRSDQRLSVLIDACLGVRTWFLSLAWWLRDWVCALESTLATVQTWAVDVRSSEELARCHTAGN